MGKGAIILVASMLITLTSMYAVEKEGEIDRIETQTDYQAAVLARETAHTALNLAVARTARDFANYRGAVSDKPYAGATYAYEAVGDREGPVVIRAEGTSQDAVHEIFATLERTGTPVLDALTIDGPVSGVKASGNSFLISGLDSPLPTFDGEEDTHVAGPDAHAIRTVLSSADDAFAARISGDQATGRNGHGDIVSGPLDVNLNTLDAAIRAHPDRIDIAGPERISGDETYGSREHPAIVVVSGDLDVRGSVSGYGILLVDGSLTLAGTVYWEGLVMARANGGDHQFKGTADIRGALVLRSLTEVGETGGEEDAGLLGGHFDIGVFSSTGALRYHDHQYDDRYDLDGVNVLAAGCEIGGGLCWDELVTNQDVTDIRISIENTEAVEGTFLYQSVGTLQSGPLDADVSFDTPVADLLALSMTFNAACDVRGAVPGSVWSDSADRGGVFRVRVHDIDDEAIGGTPILLYDLAIYRHALEAECGRSGSEQVNVMPISFHINGDVEVRSSYEALKRLMPLVPELDQAPLVVRMTSMTQAASRKAE